MDDNQLDFGDRVASANTIEVGNWLTNWMALEGTLSVNQFRGAYTTPRLDKHFTSSDLIEDGALRNQDGVYWHVAANLKADLNTLFFGYDYNRKHHFLPHVGIGTASGFGGHNSKLVLALGAGLQYQYAINPNWALVADFDSNWFGEKLDNEHCTEHDFHNSIGLKLGVCYTFTKK